jgi:hypothetical protein
MVDEMKRVATETASAVRSAPLAFVILILNAGFLWFGAYILGELASNNVQRDKAQFELIEKLINTTLECRAPLPPLQPTQPQLTPPK